MQAATNVMSAQPIVMTISSGFAQLYERYYATVYHTALRVTGNAADAEDAMQTVFLRILRQGSRLDSAQLRESYFRRAATNAALDLLRRRIAHAESELDEAFPHASADAPSLLKEQLRRALAALPQDDAELFLLRYLEGLSNGELAELSGQEKNHIAVRLHRIRQTLQTEMER